MVRNKELRGMRIRKKMIITVLYTLKKLLSKWLMKHSKKPIRVKKLRKM